MLLGLTGIAASGLEGVSFGHEHLGHGHALYHHHLFFGAHDHAGVAHPPDHHHHHHGQGQDHDQPVHGGKPRRSATLSSAVTLFHPVDASVLAAPQRALAPVAASGERSLVERPAPRSGPPRAPPVSPRYPR